MLLTFFFLLLTFNVPNKWINNIWKYGQENISNFKTIVNDSLLLCLKKKKIHKIPPMVEEAYCGKISLVIFCTNWETWCAIRRHNDVLQSPETSWGYQKNILFEYWEVRKLIWPDLCNLAFEYLSCCQSSFLN